MKVAAIAMVEATTNAICVMDMVIGLALCVMEKESYITQMVLQKNVTIAKARGHLNVVTVITANAHVTLATEQVNKNMLADNV